MSACEELDGARAELTHKPCHLFVKSCLQTDEGAERFIGVRGVIGR